jgi:hypothetical protein
VPRTSAVAILLLQLLANTPSARSVSAAPAAVSPLEDKHAWRAEHVKALDPVFDTAIPGEAFGDLMSLWYDQRGDELAFRVGIKDLNQLPEAFSKRALEIRIDLDFRRDGARRLGGEVGGACEIRVGAEKGVPFARVTASEDSGDEGAGRRLFQEARRFEIIPQADMVEISIDLPREFVEATGHAAGAAPGEYEIASSRLARDDGTPVRISVTTLLNGRIQDRIETTGQSRAGAKNVAFVQHGNQGLTYTTVFRGERGENAVNAGDVNNPDDGFDELLAAHEWYSLPGCFHLAGQLQTAAEWHDPTFNDWLATGRSAGWADMVTSAYAQHMMPFVQDAMNNWAVNVEKQMTDFRYGSNARVAWIPERVWLENPDNDGNGINAACGVVDATLMDNWMQHGVQAVILDDAWHLVRYDGVFDDRHVYVAGNGLKFVPIDNTFVGDVNWNWGNAWNTITSLSADELLVYGNDWEFVAEVSQGAANPQALNNYVQILRQCSINSATVSVWKISDAINEPSFLRNMDGRPIENATYGLLGAHGGYGGGCNSWYTDWASYDDPQHAWDQHVPRWDYGTVWNNTYLNIIGSPSNDLSESAWYVMMTNLHETGWHDNGEISGWIYRYSNHIKNANSYAEASRWADGQFANTNAAYLDDVDLDGQMEAVIHNDRVMAIFEPIGGRAAVVFAKGSGYGYSVVGNCNVFWVDTEGDYNETNHVAALSDVSVAGLDREHDLYGFEIVQGLGTTVSLRITHPTVTKTISLTQGDKYLRVIWDAAGQDVYVKNGFSPDLIDLIWSSNLDRIWAPAPSGAYFGQRNPNTGATAAVVVGNGGASHNLQYTSTLMEVDEFFGSGKFEAYLFAGETSAPQAGAIAELDSLAALLADTLAPEATSALYFPGADKLTILFDEDVRYDQIVLSGISLDDDNDGAADVTLTGAAEILTSQNSSRIDIDVGATAAAAIEALNPATVELMMAASTVKDLAGNGNAAFNHTANIAVEIQPLTLVTIDGFIDSSEWPVTSRIVEDFWDSAWTTPAPADTNDLNALWMTWDETYLYLAVQGIVYNNSWILYLDTDPGGPNGEANLTAINAWERGATFTGGFRADFQYGCYQHQGPFDSDSFFRIDSPATSTNFSGSIITAFDSSHFFYLNGGSELAIPWDVLYALGPGNVPPGAAMSLVASICWDPEPNGTLGGDSAPDNISASLPVIDSWISFTVDADGDGLPDDPPAEVGAPEIESSRTTAFPAITDVLPNPFRSQTRLEFWIPFAGQDREPAKLAIYDIRGREVRVLFDGQREAGAHAAIWNGRDKDARRVPSGVYFAKLTTAFADATRKVVLLQ